MQKIIDILTEALAWLDKATTNNSVIKLLVLCVALLIAVIGIKIALGMLKQLFVFILKPFKKKHKQVEEKISRNSAPNETGKPENDNNESNHIESYKENIKDNAVVSAAENENDQVAPSEKKDTHIEDAERVLEVIKRAVQSLQKSSAVEIPQLLPTETERALIEPEVFNKGLYQLNPAEKAFITDAVNGKSISELESIISETSDQLKTVTVMSNANKSQYSLLFSKQKELDSQKNNTVDAYNREVTKVQDIIDKQKNFIDESCESLLNNEQRISSLINKEKAAIEAAQLAKNEIVDSGINALGLVKKIYTSRSDFDTDIKTNTASLSKMQRTAEQSIASANDNYNKLYDLMSRIEDHDRQAAVASATVEAATLFLITQKAEEERRIAEEREIKERIKKEQEEKERQAQIEARLKAEEDAKRRSEESEEKTREESLRREAEAKEREARLLAELQAQAELERIADEEAKLIKAEEEARRIEEEARLMAQISREKEEKCISKETDGKNAEIASEGQNSYYNEEIDEVKRIMDQQRKQRAAASERFKEPVMQESSFTPKEEEETMVNNVSDKTANHKSDNEEDPMVAIRAMWQRERDIETALKKGDVDTAMNIANGNTNK